MVNLPNIPQNNLREIEFNDILCNCDNSIHTRFECQGAKN